MHKNQKLGAIGFDISDPPILFVDSQSSIDMSFEWKTSMRTRHLDIRYHYNRVAVIKKMIKLEKVDTKLNTSDMMTKFLPNTLLDKHRNSIMGIYTNLNDLSVQRKRARSSSSSTSIVESKISMKRTYHQMIDE
jgi:hypothetical protein